ncbi:hypothetical protein CF15_01440 [Pyrodictium occultum]|uniref:Uncharacterized protein n=1 Tax=Pyrodictium occultum TaxID=2309 RepID=A0A0V8RUA6_PYROC|nr:Tfx family DNA-binding protein [Pyrodictium occultum]KSW11530.1 hypothetical protein CF15_01440 [Pyrodictium occultum]
MAGRFGLLTHKQARVLALREGRGLGFSEIARLLGTTRQDAAATYRRALANVEAARETLRVYRLATGIVVEAVKGIPLDSLVEKLLREADSRGVKLRWARAELRILLHGLLRDYLEGSRLSRPLALVAGKDGSIEAYPLEEARRVLKALDAGGSSP